MNKYVLKVYGNNFLVIVEVNFFIILKINVKKIEVEV